MSQLTTIYLSQISVRGLFKDDLYAVTTSLMFFYRVFLKTFFFTSQTRAQFHSNLLTQEY